MSETTLSEVEIYAFESDSAQFHLTPHEFDVDLDGTRYQSLPLEHNALALGAEAAKSALELTLPPDCDLVRHLLASALTGEACAVTLRIARRDAFGDKWSTPTGPPAVRPPSRCRTSRPSSCRAA